MCVDAMEFVPPEGMEAPGAPADLKEQGEAPTNQPQGEPGASPEPALGATRSESSATSPEPAGEAESGLEEKQEPPR